VAYVGEEYVRDLCGKNLTEIWRPRNRWEEITKTDLREIRKGYGLKSSGSA
jgi:hypothetical protein